MALLNRFSKLNDRGETGVFTFIVTKSVTRDFHRDATTKDFCFGYHRWAISFQRPTEKVLGVHLLLRNPSPSTACVVDFSLTLLNREHFSQNEVYSKRRAKFTITNPMQGVSRWIQMSDLMERNFSNETGEFLFELALSNMTTIFECDIQLNPATLTQYKTMLRSGSVVHPSSAQLIGQHLSSGAQHHQLGHHHNHQLSSTGLEQHRSGKQRHNSVQQLPAAAAAGNPSELINLETNYFTFGAFDWSLTIVPLVTPLAHPSASQSLANNSENVSSSSLPSSNDESSGAITNAGLAQREPVCRVYLNRLSGRDCLCRVKYRIILGHHQASESRPAEFVDSRLLDQISDAAGRIRGYQFRNTNILKLISLRNSGQQQSTCTAPAGADATGQFLAGAASTQAASQHVGPNSSSTPSTKTSSSSGQSSSALDLRVHIEMFCANTISEARVPLQRKANEAQVSNCSDRNKQAWCVESDSENETVRLKLFFMDLQSVPRNHIRYISWIAYVVRRDSKSGSMKESMSVKNSPHCNYYLQDGIDMGTIMDTHIPVKELNESPRSYLDANQLTVHIEWVDSLLLFSHLYNNYDSLATIQRHQIRRELAAIQQEFAHLERKYLQSKRSLNQLLARNNGAGQSGLATTKATPAKDNNHSLTAAYSPQSNSFDGLDEADEANYDDLSDDEDEQGEEEEEEDDGGGGGGGGGGDAGDVDDGVYVDGAHEEAEEAALAKGRLAAEGPDGGPLDRRQLSSRCDGTGSLKQRWPDSAVNLEQSHLRNLHQPQQQPLGAAQSLPMPSVQRLAGPTYQVRQQATQRAPMSMDERLKFSSSTPPSGSQLHQQLQAQVRPTPQSATPAGHPNVRRRLPCQPPLDVLQQQHQLSHQQALPGGSHQMDSQTTYQSQTQSQLQPQPQSQQIRAVLESATPLMLEAKMGAMALGNVDKGSINEQQPSLFTAMATPERRFESMNMLMKDRLLGQSEDMSSARYHRQQQRQQQSRRLVARQAPSGFAYDPQPLSSLGQPQLDDPQAGGGYFHAMQRNLDQMSAIEEPNSACQHNRFAADDPTNHRAQPMGDEMELLYVAAAGANSSLPAALAGVVDQQQQHRLSQPLVGGYAPPDLELAMGGRRESLNGESGLLFSGMGIDSKQQQQQQQQHHHHQHHFDDTNRLAMEARAMGRPIVGAPTSINSAELFATTDPHFVEQRPSY